MNRYVKHILRHEVFCYLISNRFERTRFLFFVITSYPLEPIRIRSRVRVCPPMLTLYSGLTAFSTNFFDLSTPSIRHREPSLWHWQSHGFCRGCPSSLHPHF